MKYYNITSIANVIHMMLTVYIYIHINPEGSCDDGLSFHYGLYRFLTDIFTRVSSKEVKKIIYTLCSTK